MDENRKVFEELPVPSALMKLAFPAVISQLITLLYNLADTFFIGQTGDPCKVAAASLSYSLFFVITALSNLFGIGAGSLISRLIGARKDLDARWVSSLGLYCAILIAAIYSLLCHAFSEPILYFLGASKNTITYAQSYTFFVVELGAVPTIAGISMSHFIRSLGFAQKASIGITLGGILNIILDPLFMFVLAPEGMEVAGAAAATFVSNVAVLIYFSIVYCSCCKTGQLSFSLTDAANGLRYLGNILSVGLPSFLGAFLATMSTVFINNLISAYGDIPVAAVGIVKKIDMLPMNVGMGFCQGMMPLVAYNYASGNYKRMHSCIKYTRLFGMSFAFLCVFCYVFFAETLVVVFIDEKATLKLGVNFLRICCLALPFTFCNFQMTYTFQAMGKGRQSLLLSLCRQGIINIPLLFIMKFIWGMYGIVWTQLIADILTFALSLVLYRKTQSQLSCPT